MSSQANTYKLTFAENLALGGIAAVVSKTVAAPLERVKLLVQNQVNVKFLYFPQMTMLLFMFFIVFFSKV